MASAYTSAGLDAAFGALRPKVHSDDHRGLLSDALPATHGPSDTADVFPMPEVDNVDDFERQAVEFVKPNHGT